VAATRWRRTPILEKLCGISIFVLYAHIDVVQLHGLGSVVTSLSGAKHALRSLWRSTSATLKSVQPHLNVLLKAEVRLEENCRSCVDFLRKWLRYGMTEALACASFISYPYFSRSIASRDLKDQAARLQNERVEVPASTSIRTRQGSFFNNLIVSLSRRGTASSQYLRRFNAIHEKGLSSLQKVDHGLDILFAYLITCVTQMDTHSTSSISTTKHLQVLSCNWVKKRDVLQYLLMVLPPVDGPITPPTSPESL
jgi:hypothetical protein